MKAKLPLKQPLKKLNQEAGELLHAQPANLPDSLLHGLDASERAERLAAGAGVMTRSEVMQIAMRIGRILLKSGAETSRVEDTMQRFCKAHGAGDLNVFCTPTILVLGDELLGGDTMVSRVQGRSTDLGLIMYVNEFSFNHVRWHMDYQQAQAWLDAKMAKARPYSALVLCVAAGMGSACFAVMLGGGGHEFWGAFAAGFVSMAAVRRVSVYVPGPFWENFVGGFVLCVVAYAARLLDPAVNVEQTIVGALMPYVPGLAFTNGLRDYIAGDLLSGNARIAEAILIALAVAFGLALAMRAGYVLGIGG